MSEASSLRLGFDKTVASGVDTSQGLSVLQTGPGMAVSQASGSLVITTGTTANSETILRSAKTWGRNILLRAAVTLSQRIANNNFYLELVDVLGDNLALLINGTTSATVTFPQGKNPFKVENIGQSLYIGAISVATAPGGRYAIASVSADSVTFTVSGFPASRSGTCSLFGWNYHHILYTSTTATAVNYDAQRNGWNSGDTTATINTSASPGHIAILTVTGSKSSFQDQLSASSTTAETTLRASRIRNVPVGGSSLYLQIRAHNGSTNPGGTTTLTVGFVEVSDFSSDVVSIANIAPMSSNSPLPVNIVTGLVTATTAGQAAHDAVSSGAPVRTAGRAVTANYTAVSSGDVADFISTTVGAQIVKEYSIPEGDWTYAAAAAGIVNTTTAVTVRAAQAAGIRNYVTSLQIQTATLGAATEFAIRDGAAGTVLWRASLQTTALPLTTIVFPTPLRGTAATLLEVVTLTASVSGGIFVNLQGYSAP